MHQAIPKLLFNELYPCRLPLKFELPSYITRNL